MVYNFYFFDCKNTCTSGAKGQQEELSCSKDCPIGWILKLQKPQPKSVICALTETTDTDTDLTLIETYPIDTDTDTDTDLLHNIIILLFCQISLDEEKQYRPEEDEQKEEEGQLIR